MKIKFSWLFVNIDKQIWMIKGGQNELIN